MSTATEIAPFHSKAVSLRVTLIPEEWDRNHSGRIIDKRPALAVTFENHVAKLDAPELLNGMKYHGVSLEEVAEMLRQSKGYAEKDYWQVGDAPGQLKPSVEERNEEILRASVRGDAGAIEAELVAERETHNRPEVIKHGLAALDAMRDEA